MKTKHICILIFLTVPLTLLIWGFLLPPQYDDTFMGELKYKVRLLDAPGENRIILIGGSAAAFGVDSEVIAEILNRPVMNFGMYAALGTTVMLDLSEQSIRPGDIVILLPEQQRQTLSDYFDAAVLWQGLDGGFSLLNRLPTDKLKQMAGTFPEFSGEKFSYILNGDAPQPTGVYRRDSFNEYGDIVSPLCAANVMPGGYDASTPIRFDADVLNADFTVRVNAYAESIQAKGAEIWYAFCPLNAAAIQGDATALDFYETLRESLAFPILGNPEDSILDSGWFYDTNFHLNASGKQIYTRVLLDGILAMLGDSRPLNLPKPIMPMPTQTETFHGDDSDSEYFLYTEQDGTLTINGLTREGQTREILTVPTHWNDMPVQIIQTLGETSALRELTVQQNVRAIQDGALSDCPNLTAIHLLLESPTRCAVGDGLLDGANAKIYVPVALLSQYRTDYFWSPYAAKILAEP